MSLPAPLHFMPNRNANANANADPDPDPTPKPKPGTNIIDMSQNRCAVMPGPNLTTDKRWPNEQNDDDENL